jgi:hypothetical protein
MWQGWWEQLLIWKKDQFQATVPTVEKLWFHVHALLSACSFSVYLWTSLLCVDSGHMVWHIALYVMAQYDKPRRGVQIQKSHSRNGFPMCIISVAKVWKLNTSWDSSVSIVTRLWTGWIWFNSHIQSSSGAHPASYTMGTGESFPRVKWPGLEADHSPNLLPRLRIHGDVSPVPHASSWCGA